MYKRLYSSRADTKLFTLFVKPHKPVSSNGVARWIKSVCLMRRGIDLPQFLRHIVPMVLLSPMHIRGVFQKQKFCVLQSR